MIKRTFFIFVYIVFLLGFLELTARLMISNDYVFNKIKGMDDSSKRLEWISRKIEEKDIYYDLVIYHPTRGWAVKPNQNSREVFKDVLGLSKNLSTNTKGLRGKEEFDYNKPKDKFRILILGDSFTFGWEVSDNETFSYVLQEKLQDVEVINLGVFGYGQDQMLLYLKEEGVKYKPDLIILGFLGADMRRNLLAFRDFVKPKYILEHDKLKLTNYPVPSPSEILKNEFLKLKTLDLVNMFIGKLKWKMGINDNKMEELTSVILDEIIKQSKEIDAEICFINLPVWFELRPGRSRGKYEPFIEDYCSRRNIHCLNLSPVFLEEGNMKGKDWGYPHWNAKAHRLAGEAISEYLQKNQMLTAF